MKTSKSLKPTLKMAVCLTFGIPPGIIFNKNRERKIVEARNAFVYMAMEMEEGNGPSVVGRMANLSHCDTYHCIKSVNLMYRQDQKFRDKMDRLLNMYYNKMILMPTTFPFDPKRYTKRTA